MGFVEFCVEPDVWQKLVDLFQDFALLDVLRPDVPDLDEVVFLPGRDGQAADVVAFVNLVAKLLANRRQQQLLPNTGRLSFWAFDSPHSSVGQRGIFPEWFFLLSHQVVIGAKFELERLWDVMEDAPESLHSRHRVNLLQVGLVFGHGGVVHRPVQPEGPRSLQGNSGLLQLGRVESVQGRGRQFARRKRHHFRRKLGTAAATANLPIPILPPGLCLTLGKARGDRVGNWYGRGGRRCC